MLIDFLLVTRHSPLITVFMEISIADRSALLALIERFSRQKIAVLGDLVADEFIHGEIARVSREAPVLILHQRERRIVPGGAANAANNLIEMGSRIGLVGVVGEDESGAALLDYFRQKGVSTRGVRRLKGYVTPTKSRVLGGMGHSQMQQIVRVDREPARELGSKTRQGLLRRTLPLLAHSSALLISDYGYGACNPKTVGALNRRKGNPPCVVDSRYRILSYNHVTASTPNEPEMEAAFGVRVGNDLRVLRRCADRALEACSLKALLITRGREGMALYEPHSRPQVLPIFGSDQVADVTGAGDTVIAAFTLSLAAGASFLHAAMLANCAGGLVVMKSGTATVTARELAEAIRNL
ncbi:MAG: bifunctional heptose 7-phosphate kinase/heptose 1-phosphate adenyltransferase [Terriglobia bacterium]